jgi:hypothetical protein
MGELLLDFGTHVESILRPRTFMKDLRR